MQAAVAELAVTPMMTIHQSQKAAALAVLVQKAGLLVQEVEAQVAQALEALLLALVAKAQAALAQEAALPSQVQETLLQVQALAAVHLNQVQGIVLPAQETKAQVVLAQEAAHLSQVQETHLPVQILEVALRKTKVLATVVVLMVLFWFRELHPMEELIQRIFGFVTMK